MAVLKGSTSAPISASPVELSDIASSPRKTMYFVAGYRGIDARRNVGIGTAPGKDGLALDGISGATVTAIVFNDSIMRAARAVARSRGIIRGPGPGGAAAVGRLDREQFAETDWQGLMSDGSLRRLLVRNSEVDERFHASAGRPVPAVTEVDPSRTFIDLTVALGTPAGIGQNLLGFAPYSQLLAADQDRQVIFVAANGLYSFKGWNWRRKGGWFDRFQIVQGNTTVRFEKADHQRVERLAITGAPEFREMGMFTIPRHKGFDPTEPWRLELMVERDSEAGPVQVSFALNYQVPARYVAQRAKEDKGGGGIEAALSSAGLGGPNAVWLTVWQGQVPEIVILIAALSILTLMLVFSDWLARRSGLALALRLSFLGFTLVALGWLMTAWWHPKFLPSSRPVPPASMPARPAAATICRKMKSMRYYLSWPGPAAAWCGSRAVTPSSSAAAAKRSNSWPRPACVSRSCRASARRPVAPAISAFRSPTAAWPAACASLPATPATTASSTLTGKVWPISTPRW